MAIDAPTLSPEDEVVAATFEGSELPELEVETVRLVAVVEVPKAVSEDDKAAENEDVVVVLTTTVVGEAVVEEAVVVLPTTEVEVAVLVLAATDAEEMSVITGDHPEIPSSPDT